MTPDEEPSPSPAPLPGASYASFFTEQERCLLPDMPLEDFEDEIVLTRLMIRRTLQAVQGEQDTKTIVRALDAVSRASTRLSRLIRHRRKFITEIKEDPDSELERILKNIHQKQSEKINFFKNLLIESNIRLTDDQWRLVEPLLPPLPPSGRPPHDRRRVLEAIFYKLVTDFPWVDLPPTSYPPAHTVYHHYGRWRRLGVLHRILAALQEDLRTRGGLDLQQALQDGQIRIGGEGDLAPVIIPDDLAKTWQGATAIILIRARQHMKSENRPPPRT